MDLFTIFCICLGLIMIGDRLIRIARKQGKLFNLCQSMVQQNIQKGQLDKGLETISMFYFLSLITDDQKEKLVEKFQPSNG